MAPTDPPVVVRTPDSTDIDLVSANSHLLDSEVGHTPFAFHGSHGYVWYSLALSMRLCVHKVHMHCVLLSECGPLAPIADKYYIHHGVSISLWEFTAVYGGLIPGAIH